MGLALLVMAIFNGAVFIGIPVLSALLFRLLSKDKLYTDIQAKNRMRRKSLVIAVITITFILGLTLLFLLSNIDLTYS
jgi:hypothetical protein